MPKKYTYIVHHRVRLYNGTHIDGHFVLVTDTPIDAIATVYEEADKAGDIVYGRVSDERVPPRIREWELKRVALIDGAYDELGNHYRLQAVQTETH